jgi:hypothetical protein
MTDDLGFERLARDWLELGPVEAPSDVVQAAFLEINKTPQERDLRVPWRFPPMSSFAKVAIAVIAVLAVGTVGVIALRPAGNGTVGSAQSPTPAPTPTLAPTPTPTLAPTRAPTPTPTVAPTAPPLTGSFTSSIHGISLSYPAGWSTKPATEPWTTEGNPLVSEPYADILHDPVLGDHLFAGVASQPLAGKTGDQWVADFQASSGCGPAEPVTVDGASGSISEGGGCIIAALAVDGRGYFVWLSRSTDEPWLDEVYDRAWFEQLLATVDLRPEDAVDAAP